MRRQQLQSLQAMIADLKTDASRLEKDNNVLTNAKQQMQKEEATLDMRLKAILKEKELLFARLMDVDNAVAQLQQ